MRRLLAALLIALLATGSYAIPLGEWSKTAGSNNSSVPDGAPENWTGSQVNDWGRQTMKVVRDWYDDPQWLEITYDLAARGAKALSKIDADTIDIESADATAYYTAGRRIKIVGATTVTCFVVSSAINAGDTRVEVGTSCTVPTAPTATYVYFGADIKSGAFATQGSGGGLDADTVDGAHAAQLSSGLLGARIIYASASTVTIGRGYAQKVRAEIDGVVTESSSDLTVDITTADRENTAACGGSASEQASTWYYLYLANSSGVPVEHISSTAPVMDPASGKVGYHPGTCGGTTGWRAIGAVYNNATPDIQPFDYNVNTGLWTFRILESTGISSFSPGTGVQATYTTFSISAGIPATARAVRLEAEILGDDMYYWYGHESIGGTTVVGNNTPNEAQTNGSGTSIADNVQFEIAVDSTPTCAWGNSDSGGGSRLAHQVIIAGWYDDLGIVH
jgi:hypothetical protein